MGLGTITGPTGRAAGPIGVIATITGGAHVHPTVGTYVYGLRVLYQLSALRTTLPGGKDLPHPTLKLGADLIRHAAPPYGDPVIHDTNTIQNTTINRAERMGHTKSVYRDGRQRRTGEATDPLWNPGIFPAGPSPRSAPPPTGGAPATGGAPTTDGPPDRTSTSWPGPLSPRSPASIG